MRHRFDNKYLAGLKLAAEGKRYDVYDDSFNPGLLLVRVTAHSKSFMIRARFGSKNSRRKLGAVGVMTIAQAQAKARLWGQLNQAGIDPKDQEERDRLEAARAKGHTFLSVASAYFKHVEAEKLVKAETIKRQITNEFIGDGIKTVRKLPSLASRSIHDTLQLKAEIRSVINAAKDRGAKSQARVLLSSVRAMFSWAIDTDEYELAVSPVAAMRPKAVIGTLQPRDRALSDDELRALWSSVNAEPYPWAPMFKLLILSGQRLGDWSNASWKEIGPRTDEGGDQRCLTIPKERYKGRKHAHVVPLTARMLAILAECPRFTKGDYIFSANGHWGVTPVQNFWKPKERLDARMPADTPPWRAHDIRRTVRTNLSPLKGVEEHHREATIGHVKLGLKAVYDKWEYFDEKLDCLEKWDQRLTTILTPPDNVVRISEARARK